MTSNAARHAPKERFIVEGPGADAAPAKYGCSTLPADVALEVFVAITKRRWRTERDYQNLKQEIALGHYEWPRLAQVSPSRHPLHRRLWFLHLRAKLHSPSATNQTPLIKTAELPKSSSIAALPIRPERHVENSITTMRIAIARRIAQHLDRCPWCQQSRIL